MNTREAAIQHAFSLFGLAKGAAEKAPYDEFTEKQKDLSSENIRKHMHHLSRHPGGREQAIAIGLSQAAEGKKEKAASKAGTCSRCGGKTHCPSCD